MFRTASLIAASLLFLIGLEAASEKTSAADPELQHLRAHETAVFDGNRGWKHKGVVKALAAMDTWLLAQPKSVVPLPGASFDLASCKGITAEGGIEANALYSSQLHASGSVIGDSIRSHQHYSRPCTCLQKAVDSGTPYRLRCRYGNVNTI